MTIQESINYIAKAISNLYEPNEAQAIAKLYISEKLQLSNTQLIINKNEIADYQKLISIESDIARLQNAEPVQYVLGKAFLYDLQFLVNKNVLIPRQETELLIDAICKENSNSNKTIIDLGCGSGCIAISVKKNCPQTKVYAVDISTEALDITKQNANSNNVELQTAKYDILSEEILPFDTEFDIVVSNPPYVCECEKAQMHKNVTLHEPKLALYVPDSDPLLFYRKILQLISKHQTGHKTEIFFEINEAYEQEMIELCKEYNYSNINIINDLNNKPRHIRAIKN